MATTLRWDLAQDAQCTIARNSGDRMVRCGLVEGLDAETTTSEKMLGDAVRAACEANGGIPTTYPHPDYSTATLAYVTAQAHPQDATKAKIWAGYEPITFSGSQVDRFAVEDTTTLVNEPTMFYPGTLHPIVVSLTLDVPPDNPTSQDARFRAISANYPRNYRALVLHGLFSSKPSVNMLTAANRVNSQTWQGLPRGYWRCEGPRVTWGSAQGLYSVSVGFLSRGSGPGDDWSTYELARDPTTGQYLQVSKTVMAALLGGSYDVGPQNVLNGVLKAGLYNVANFGVIFDPLIDDTPLAQSDGFANLVGR